MVAPHPAHTRHTHPCASTGKQGRVIHHWTEAGAYHRNESGGRSSMSAGHRQRARMIKNHSRQKQEWTRADLKPRVERTRAGAPVCQLVHLLSNPFRRIARLMGNTEPLSRTATRRPDNRPVSSLFQQCRPLPCGGEDFARALWLPPQANTLLLGHSVEKRNFVRPYSRVPLLAPFPSRPSTPWPHALWIFAARPSSRPPSDLDPQWRL